MKQIAIILITILLSQSSVFGQISKRNTYDLAIKNVDIFDSKTKKILKNKTILVKDDTIFSIVNSTKKVKAKKSHQRQWQTGYSRLYRHAYAYFANVWLKSF